jgi:hypothetical protein
MITVSKCSWVAGLLMLCVIAPAVERSKNDDFDAGKILSVQKLAAQPSPTTPGGSASGAPASNPADRYNVSILVGDTVYVFEYGVENEVPVPWQAGETRQVRVKNNEIAVKGATEHVDTYPIVRTEKASSQSPK